MAEKPIHQSGIYCIRNLVSGRVYVGSAVTIRTRWAAHRHLLNNGKHHSKTLQRSWNKHGKDAFSFEILELVSEPMMLIPREQVWIDAIHASCPVRGFNVSPTAASPLGVRHSAETKAKHSAARKGRKRPPFSAEHRAKIAAARRGTKASDEAKAKISAAHKGRKRGPLSAEHRAKLSAARMGRKATDEERAKMSAYRKGRKRSPEAAAKMRIVLTKRNQSAEHRALARERARNKRLGDLSNQIKLL